MSAQSNIAKKGGHCTVQNSDLDHSLRLEIDSATVQDSNNLGREHVDADVDMPQSNSKPCNIMGTENLGKYCNILQHHT